MRSKMLRAFRLTPVITLAALSTPLVATAANLDCSQAGTWNLPLSEDAQGVVVSGNTAYIAARYDYRVEYSTDLVSNVRNTAANSIGATSNTCTYTDPAMPDQPTRYYRVLALP